MPVSKAASMDRLRARHLAFRQRLPVERPLVGLYKRSMFPDEEFISYLRKDGEVEPADIDLELWLSLYEEVWRRTGLAWGDLLHHAHPLKVPWLEAIAGCPVYVSRESGSFWAGTTSGFRLGYDEVSLDLENPWFQLLLQATGALVELADGRFPVCSGAMRGISDLLAAILGDRFYLAVYDDPEALSELAQQVADLYIEVVRAQYETIPPFAGGYVNYGLWTPGPSPVYQEDASSLISGPDFERLIGPHARRILMACEYPIMHLHSTGLHILPSILATERLPVIEVHLDPSGPPLEKLLPTLRQIQDVAPLQIFGDQDKIMHCLKELRYEGLACLILESSLEDSDT